MAGDAANQKRAFSHLVDLGPAVMEAIDDRLTRGESGLQVARWLQQDLKQLVTLKTESLKKKLERYRTHVLRPRLEDEARARLSAEPITVVANISSNALTQLEALAYQQQQRVNAIIERERQIPGGILLKDVAGEIRLLKDILDSVARVQLETGRMRKAPKTVTGTVVDEEGNTRVFTWTEETEALYHQLKVVEIGTDEEVEDA